MNARTNLMMMALCAFSLLNGCSHVTGVQDKPVQVAFINFEDTAELANWNLGSIYGHTELDQTIKFEGARSIHFSPDSGCYVVDRKTGIDVQGGKRYSISFNVIVTPAQVGGPAYCAGDFILTVKQGNEEILYQSVFDAPAWEKKTYYFQAKNDLPVNLNFIVGNDVWLDDLSMVRELD